MKARIIGLALWLLEIWADQRHSRKVARRVSLRIVTMPIWIMPSSYRPTSYDEAS